MTSVPGQTLCGPWALAMWAAEWCKREKRLLVKYYQHHIYSLKYII